MAIVRLENNIGTCPICEQAMTPSLEGVKGSEYWDTYSCSSCGIGVTYISPADGKAYYEYPDGKIRIVFERD